MRLKLFCTSLFVLFFSVSSVHAGTISRPPYSLTLNSGLVGHWTFDGANVVNGVIRDISGQGNHGNTISIATSTFYTAGKIGQGLQFDGVDDEIPFDSVTAFDFSTANRFTISAWVKPDGNNAGDIVLSRGSVFTSPDYVVYHLGISNTNLTRYQASISDGTNQLMLNSPIDSVVVNQWQHLSLVWDGTTLVLYKDGVSVGSVTGTFTGLWNGDIVAKRKTSIGANGMDDNFYFDGGIDDVRVYNRALSASEIAQLYNFGASKLNVTKTPTGLQSGLVGHWTFDGKDMSGGVARDISGQGNHGNTVSIATSTFYTQGRIGQGVKFDGVNDRISLGGPTLTTTHSFSFWIKPLPSLDPNYASIIVNNSLSPFNGLFFVSASNRINYYYNGAHTNNTNLTMGAWHHVVVSVNAGNVTFYLNGVADGTHSNATAWTANKMGVSNYGEPLNATLDDMRVYDRALSASEALQLYNVGAPKTNATVSPPGLKSGLVGHWTFDGKNMSGGVARDISGQGNNGFLFNIATSTFYTAGRLGQGANFDGVDDYISLGASNTYDFSSTNAFTIALWIKPPGNTNASNTFIRGSSNTSADSTVYLLQTNSSDATAWTGRVSDGTTRITLTITGAVTVNQWQHLALTWNGATKTLELYKNGVSIGSATDSNFTTLWDGNEAVDENTAIGADIRSTPRHFGKGIMDDVRVYNRTLSAGEVLQLYATGK